MSTRGLESMGVLFFLCSFYDFLESIQRKIWPERFSKVYFCFSTHKCPTRSLSFLCSCTDENIRITHPTSIATFRTDKGFDFFWVIHFRVFCDDFSCRSDEVIITVITESKSETSSLNKLFSVFFQSMNRLLYVFR